MLKGVSIAFGSELSRYSARPQTGRTGFDSWQGQDFFLLHSFRTGSGTQPASYPLGTGVDFRGGKAAVS
jgi:hypothetical protein